MKQEHKYAQVLRWIADGECIQHNFRGEWRVCANGSLLLMIANGSADSPSTFRIAPRTITIAGREIEAPVDVEYAKKSHDACYVMATDGAVRHSSHFSLEYLLACAEAGFVFANEDSALRALEAVKSALKGAGNA